MLDGMKVVVVMDWVGWLLVDEMKPVVLMGEVNYLRHGRNWMR